MEILTCALRLILLYTVTVYAKEKKVNPTAKGMSAHQFFTQLCGCSKRGILLVPN